MIDFNKLEDTVSEVTPEVVPEVTPEVVPEVTPEVVPETIPESMPAANRFVITESTTCLALIKNNTNIVETFIRIDIPVDWQPPEGFSVIPDDQLPEGWSKMVQEIPVPSTITATQIRLWLVNNGFSMQQIYDIVSQIPDPLLKAQIEVQWEYAPYVERNHPMINTLGYSLGLSSEQIDQAFREASSL